MKWSRTGTVKWQVCLAPEPPVSHVYSSFKRQRGETVQGERKTAGWSRKIEVGDRKKWRIRKTRTRIRREKEREGALFRQPDNIPSPEHIYGCPLTPSSSSLWRQSQWCWPACRFPIICLAEGSCLPHTSAGLDMQTLMAIHQPLPTPPHYDPRNKILYTHIRCAQIYGTLVVQISMLVENSTLNVVHILNWRAERLHWEWRGPTVNPLKHPCLCPSFGNKCLLGWRLDTDSQLTRLVGH